MGLRVATVDPYLIVGVTSKLDVPWMRFGGITITVPRPPAGDRRGSSALQRSVAGSVQTGASGPRPPTLLLGALGFKTFEQLASERETLNKQHAVSDTEGHKIFASGYADAVACLPGRGAKFRIFARSVRHGRPRQASMSTR